MATDQQLKAQETSRLLGAFLGDRFVLVVDPSPNYRTSLKQFLINLRVKNILCVSTVKEAKRLMITKKIGLLLVEWLGDDENGLHFCRHLQQTREYQDIPYLLMTGENLRQDVMLASEVGIDAYLLKPFSYEDLVAKLGVMIKGVTTPNPVAQFVSQGVHALQNERWDDAEQAFSEALLEDPASAKAATGLAEVCLHRGENKKAASLLKQALSYNTNYMAAHRILLQLYEKENNFDGLYTEAKILNRESPDNPRYTLLLATLYLRRQKLDESEQFFKRTVSLSPALGEAYKGLGFVALERKEHEKAAKMFKKALDLDKDDIGALNSLGLAYIHLGMYKEGIQKYKIALSLNPHDARIHFNLGQAYERQKDLDKACYYYDKALKLKPDYEKAIRALARLRNPGVAS